MNPRRYIAYAIAIGASCSTPCPAAAEAPGPVVISEIKWMGSMTSSSDEWIELYNLSPSPIDLDGWVIAKPGSDGEVQEMVRLEAGTLAPGEVFLVSNFGHGDDRTSLDVAPDLVNSAVSLANSKLQVLLYDGTPGEGGRLVDRADDGSGAPLAGDGKLKHAMVRVDFEADGTLEEAWATATDAAGWRGGAAELGTPGTIPARLLSTSIGSSATAVPATGWAALKKAARPN